MKNVQTTINLGHTDNGNLISGCTDNVYLPTIKRCIIKNR